MRKLLGLLFIPLLVLGFVGCMEKEENVKGDFVKNIDLETYVKTAELPEHFSIAFDPTEVETVDKASVHTASILEFDEQERNVVIDELVHGEIIDTKNYAEGPWLEADHKGVKEYLTIYDGGESFGIDSGVNGGLTYGMYVDEISFINKMSLVIENSQGPPGNIAQEFKYNLKSDYGSYVNLSFIDYTDALSAVEDILYSVGLPEVSVAETYSVDLDTMLEHYDLYLDSKDYFGIKEEDDKYVWTKDDESYLLFFRQIIDDIPLINLSWPKAQGIPGQNIGPSNEVGYTSIDVIYTKDGVVDLRAINLLDVVKGGEEGPLLNGATALKSVIDSYSEVLLAKETSVTSMELFYVAILVDEESYKLVPAWVFEISEENEQADPIDDTKTTYLEYSYFVVNAITGDRIEKASDMK